MSFYPRRLKWKERRRRREERAKGIEKKRIHSEGSTIDHLSLSSSAKEVEKILAHVKTLPAETLINFCGCKLVSMAPAKPYIVFIITISYHLIDGVSMVLREPIGQIEVLKSWQDFEDLNRSLRRTENSRHPGERQSFQNLNSPLAIWSRLDPDGNFNRKRMETLKGLSNDVYAVYDKLHETNQILLDEFFEVDTIIHRFAVRRAEEKSAGLKDVKYDGMALAYAPDFLRFDREVVIEAIRQNGQALRYASDELKNDKLVVVEALKQNWHALSHATRLKGDRSVIIIAIHQNGNALLYASNELKNDRTLVLQAVRRNGRSLQYASAALKGDREIVMEAVKEDGAALLYATTELQRDRGLMERAVEHSAHLLLLAEELKNDRDLVRKAVVRDWRALEYFPPAIRGDREIMLQAIKQNWGALQYASKELQDDRGIVLEALRQNFAAIKWTSANLKLDPYCLTASLTTQ